ncbi:sodium-dependent nutrient amino acid transporter 1-like [Anopheles ziemanni]|uniref:sodium-dependent nutrient amino acid transporter 1-like n=1 Tax=Anopheles coustani TaxID=139045 RepID=UPI00265B3E83|nr:sodium-dependent nutrient amino acid transporter 1-like [Anopheles coustani]XP_058174804.1 sodium-dependent nutrient amino acid transporter 1-like [Anopheles ziemanni]
MSGADNPAFVGTDDPGLAADANRKSTDLHQNGSLALATMATAEVAAGPEKPPVERAKWDKGVEFLMSCIALSVGLGNVWKFPSTAFRNGGGAFVIPYLIVLLIVGRPIYYLEMVMGQFSSRGSVKVYDVSPIMRGIGIAQMVSICVVIVYYAATIATAIRFFVASFESPLPWASCDVTWTGLNCVNSSNTGPTPAFDNALPVKTSAELYYTHSVTGEGLLTEGEFGVPDWKLTLCLLFIWVAMTIMMIKGIRGSGKVAYFLALFPYLVLISFAVYAFTLDGAGEGLKYFITPDWDKLLSADVWKEAVSQCFFSLSICFGGVIAFSSYNNFSNNIYRDAMIISWLDTFTSLLSGSLVFAIIGHLGHLTNETDYTKVVYPGSGLTFITYPDALAKFEHVPNLFALLFFFMLLTLGVGSCTGLINSVLTALQDSAPRLKSWKTVCVIGVLGFGLGLLFVTPSGSKMLDYFDYYGVQFVTLTSAIFELFAFCWLYGIRKLTRDIQFMLNRRTGFLWRLCWRFVTPILLIVVLVIGLVKSQRPAGIDDVYHVLGWCIYAGALVPIPLWAWFAVRKRTETTLTKRIIAASKPLSDWGPEELDVRKRYLEFCNNYTPLESRWTRLRRVLHRNDKTYRVSV